VDIDLGREPVRRDDVCKFRHLLEQHHLGARIFERVQEHLQERGLRIGTGTIVDATIVHAPSSTKNARQERDPEMHPTRKGSSVLWMKAHVGVDSKSKLIHAVVATPANVADSRVLPDLLHGDETRVWGDQAYRDRAACWRSARAGARLHCQRYRYKDRWMKWSGEEPHEAKVRSKVEHVFAVMKLSLGL